MSAKKQENQVESVRNAVTGYTVVVLGIICFVLALAVIMAGVRIVTGVTANTTAATTTTTIVVSGSGAA